MPGYKRGRSDSPSAQTAPKKTLPAESVNGHADGQVNGHEQEQPATTTTKPVPACDPFIAMSPEDMVAQLTQADKVAFLQQSAQREATVRYAHLVREGGLLTRHHLEFLVKERGGAYTLPDTPHLLAEPVKTELDKWLDEVKAAIIKHLNKDLNKDNDNDMDEDEDDGEDEQKGGDEGGDNDHKGAAATAAATAATDVSLATAAAAAAATLVLAEDGGK